MPTLREAQALFDVKSEAGEIPNRVTGKTGQLAASRRGPIMSHVTAALRHALRSFPEYARVSADALLDVEIAPFLATLPDHAELDASEAGRSDPSKERSNVALFVTVVTGRDAVREKRSIEVTRVLPAWQPLYDALCSQASEQPKARTYPRLLIRFMELALANGVVSPEAVPDDFDAVHAWAPALGFSRKEVHEALGAFRSAADALGDDSLPRAYDLVFRGGIGVRGLSDWVQRARNAGMTGDPMSWELLDIITALAPKIGNAVRTVLSAGKKHNRTASYENEIIDCGSWLVASLIRLGEDVSALTLLDLYLERREIRVEQSAAAEEGRKVKLAQLAKYTTTPTHDAPMALHSLLRRCLDVTAPLSYANSPLRLVNPVHEEDDIPVYTDSMIANVKQAFLLTKAMFGAELEEVAPDVWARARNEHDSLLRHISSHNRGRYLAGRKAKRDLLITWPQAVCMGLPYLRQKALMARRAVADRADRIGHLESRESQKVLLAYCEALRDYVVVAILLDDSLRIRNYAGATAGIHLKPTPEIIEGCWRRFVGARTHFRGADADDVRLKVLARKDEGLNERERPLTPGIVDMDLLFEWWTKARPFYLVQAGLLTTVDAYDPERDNYAVFPTGRPSEAQRADPAWKGHISPDMLSEIFGRALHEICMKVLGQTDLPEWGDASLTETHRSLFCAHIVRLLVGTYFGGVLGDWTTAEYRTNDRELTLRKHYNLLAPWFTQRMHKQSHENPRWFDRVIARVLEARDCDVWGPFWDRFDPRYPDASLAALDARSQPSGRAPQVRARRTA